LRRVHDLHLPLVALVRVAAPACTGVHG
jgi:hypothetical protein